MTGPVASKVALVSAGARGQGAAHATSTLMLGAEGAENSAGFIAGLPIRRAAEPGDVSLGVLYLHSDEALYVTGTELVIAGGFLARG